MKLMRNSMVALLSLAVLAGCTEDDPFVPPETGPVEHTFTYVAHAETPTFAAVDVRGSFNNWGGDGSEAYPMTQQTDGSWAVTVELDPATYEYKYTFDGNWAAHMCEDPTYGNPPGGKVDPAVVECNEDGFGGANGILVIE